MPREVVPMRRRSEWLTWHLVGRPAAAGCRHDSSGRGHRPTTELWACREAIYAGERENTVAKHAYDPAYIANFSVFPPDLAAHLPCACRGVRGYSRVEEQLLISNAYYAYMGFDDDSATFGIP